MGVGEEQVLEVAEVAFVACAAQEGPQAAGLPHRREERPRPLFGH